jgi:hypothetical protein
MDRRKAFSPIPFRPTIPQPNGRPQRRYRGVPVGCDEFNHLALCRFAPTDRSERQPFNPLTESGEVDA